MGQSRKFRMLVVVHCFRKARSSIRIITARKSWNQRTETILGTKIMRSEYDFTKAKRNPYAKRLKKLSPFGWSRTSSTTSSRCRVIRVFLTRISSTFICWTVRRQGENYRLVGRSDGWLRWGSDASRARQECRASLGCVQSLPGERRRDFFWERARLSATERCLERWERGRFWRRIFRSPGFWRWPCLGGSRRVDRRARGVRGSGSFRASGRSGI